MSLAPRLDVALVAGGQWHDIDHARLELLGLLAEHERLRVTVHPDYADTETLAAADILISYTCNVVPAAPQIAALQSFLEAGGRWFALHGTNSALELADDGPVRCPPLPPRFRAMLGSQFLAHPAPGRFKVTNAAPDHPLVAGISSFLVEDEHYLQAHEVGNIPLLVTRFAGETPLFERTRWEDGEHQVMYLRPQGPGAVLYLSLGHSRGRYDMRPLAETYPHVERGAWVLPVYRELLRRGIAWAAARPPRRA